MASELPNISNTTIVVSDETNRKRDREDSLLTNSPKKQTLEAHSQMQHNQRNQSELNFIACFDGKLSSQVMKFISVEDLMSMGMTCKTNLAGIKGMDEVWRLRYSYDIGELTPLVVEASKIAGSWFELYKTYKQSQKAHPVRECISVCKYELAAYLQKATGLNLRDCEKELRIMFLLDGSGSVNDDFFKSMKKLILDIVSLLLGYQTPHKVGMIQFSTKFGYDLPIAEYDFEQLKQILDKMEQYQQHTQIYSPSIAAYRILADEDFYKGKDPTSESVLSMTGYLSNLQQNYIGSPTCHNLVLLVSDCCINSMDTTAYSIQHFHNKFQNISFGIMQCGYHYQVSNEPYDEDELVDLFLKQFNQSFKFNSHHMKFVSMPLHYESE